MTEPTIAANPPLRLVKLRLSAELVRDMDRMIASSEGAYIDRNEFVTEAIRDRIEEERGSGHVALTRPPMAASIESGEDALVPQALGQWRNQHVPAGPSRSSSERLFGLHNRDLPTLVAADTLCRLALHAGGPIPWGDFVKEVAPQALAWGVEGRRRDARISAAIKWATAFPDPRRDQAVATRRYLTAFVGNRPGEGPLFVLGLAICDDAELIWPTTDGVEVLTALLEAGLGSALPHPAPCAGLWWGHLGRVAPEEVALFERLLKVVSSRPSRAELIGEFIRWADWSSSVADTNTMGLIARGREWGLIEAELTDRRYALTKAGLAFHARGTA